MSKHIVCLSVRCLFVAVVVDVFGGEVGMKLLSPLTFQDCQVLGRGGARGSREERSEGEQGGEERGGAGRGKARGSREGRAEGRGEGERSREGRSESGRKESVFLRQGKSCHDGEKWLTF